MEDLAVCVLSDGMLRRLRKRANEHGRSVDDELKAVLLEALGPNPRPKDIGRAVHKRFAALGGVDLPIPPRVPDPDTT